MGVTLPTIPARLVKRILAGEFVDMGELSQDALRAEFRRSTEGEEKPSKAKPFWPVADRDAWVTSFAQVRRGGESLLSAEGCGSMGARVGVKYSE